MSKLTLPEAIRAGGKIASRRNGIWYVDHSGLGCCALGAAMLGLGLTEKVGDGPYPSVSIGLTTLHKMYPELTSVWVEFPNDPQIPLASMPHGRVSLRGAIETLAHFWEFDEIADWVEAQLRTPLTVYVEEMSVPGIGQSELIEVG